MQDVVKCGFDAVERVRMGKASGRAAPCGIGTVALHFGDPCVIHPRRHVVQTYVAVTSAVAVVVVVRG